MLVLGSNNLEEKDLRVNVRKNQTTFEIGGKP